MCANPRWHLALPYVVVYWERVSPVFWIWLASWPFYWLVWVW